MYRTQFNPSFIFFTNIYKKHTKSFVGVLKHMDGLSGGGGGIIDERRVFLIRVRLERVLAAWHLFGLVWRCPS